MYLIKVGIVKKAYLRKSPSPDDGRLKKKSKREGNVNKDSGRHS